MTQIQRLLRFTRILIVFVLVPSFIFISTDEASAKSRHGKVSVKKSKSTGKSHRKNRRSSRKRSYYPDLTRQQAIDLIRTNSEQVSELAGLDPLVASVNNIPQSIPDYEEGEDIDELAMEDDVPVDMDNFRMLWLSYIDGDETDGAKSGGIAKQDIMGTIMDWLGTPYYFGGMTDRGIDCSAFVQRIFLTTNRIMLPRTASEQFGVGLKVDRTNLKFGDIIFFHTRRAVYVSHVGIYLGDNLFAHASSRYGVTVSSLESTYYNNRFIGARRLSASDLVKLSLNNKEEELH